MPEERSKEEKALLRKITKEEKDGIIYTSFFETDKFIIEQLCPIKEKSATLATAATSISNIQYILYDKQTASIDYLDSLEYAGRTFKPINAKSLTDNVISLPSGIEEYGTTCELIKDISDFLYDNFEAPKFYEKFLPYIVLFSWVYEKFPFVPYVHFVGLTATGKTTAAETMASVCYKTIDASGAITLSPLFRMADTWRGTLFLDEFEPDGENYKEIIGLLKAGVGNRAVLRTEGDSKREVVAYLIKSMKIFTSERPINSAGLRSRMFVIEMNKSTRRIPLFKQKKYYEKAISIRNKLLLWRLRNLDKIDLQEIEYGFQELSGFDRRVQQVITPIYYLSDEKSRETILEFAKTQELETKRERLESLEGEIFQIIFDNLPNDTKLKDITDKINMEKGRRPHTEKKIANVIRQVLQFDIKRIGHDNISTVLVHLNPERLENLIDYFGVYAPENGVASVAEEKKDTLEQYDAEYAATHEETEQQELI